MRAARVKWVCMGKLCERRNCSQGKVSVKEKCVCGKVCVGKMCASACGKQIVGLWKTNCGRVENELWAYDSFFSNCKYERPNIDDNL